MAATRSRTVAEDERTMTARLPRLPRPFIAALVALLALASTERAAAFCGFYVTGADTSLYANATMVVLMRDGTRTVLSMQNNYQGPPDTFALVIPVPVVLQKENVKVLPKDVFQRVDALGAPRLVEYWEVDPCQVTTRPGNFTTTTGAVPMAASPSAAAGASAPVRIEAQFTVGEYDVVVLSADDSSALDTWLRDNKYNIPAGAGPVLAPYVAAGMKFFVAKVEPTRVTFNGNQAALSPLRFHYDTPEFSLPVRLGLLNSQGSQDLIVNILATQRYEVANYPNVTVPTNIRVQNDVRQDFASFYEALYSRVLEKNPKAVVTEYAWASGSCDPCPTPPLGTQDLLTLGADVLQTATGAAQPTPGGSGGGGQPFVPVAPGQGPSIAVTNNFTLTRLHARYTKDMLGEDLVFQTASGITGGRGIPDTKGNLDQAVMQNSGSYSDFQGRYVILHPWDKAISCMTPQRGLWGGPSGTMGSSPQTQAPANGALTGAAPRAGDLPALLAESVPSLSVVAKTPVDPLGPTITTTAAGSGTQPAAGKPAATTTTGAAGQAQAAGSKAVLAHAGAGALTTPVASTTKKSSGCAIAGGASDNGLMLVGLFAGLMSLGKRRTRRGLARVQH
jgi:hypothetical protein